VWTDYEAAGSNYLAAWDILAEKMKVPPSWEVFSHGYEKMARKRRGITPQGYAISLLAKV